jgi:uncharacterized membrane protein YdjX (TVP38/TMEM64 family)
MSSEVIAGKGKLRWLKLGVAALVLVAGAVLVLIGVDVRGLVDQGMNLIGRTGPVVFFTAMALTPAVGVPATLFTLTAGPVFGPQLGMPWVIVLCMAAIMFNVALTHFLARRALRPLLEKLMARLGYTLPEVPPEDMTDLAIIVRVTPGSPFPVQNYLLGLANVPFGRNLLVAFVVQLVYTPAFVLFGDALRQGKGKLAMFAVGLLVAAAAGTHLLRKHYAKKKLPA